MRNVIINILVVISASLIALGAAEWGVRAAGLWYFPPGQPDWYVAQTSLPGVPYLLKPELDVEWGQGRVRGNSMGLRDRREPGTAKTGRRILAIGDSLTFGFGAGENDTYPRWMERIVNHDTLVSNAGRIEVINAGMNGFNLADASALLPSLIERYQPDMIVWFIISNDFDDSLAAQPDGVLTSAPQIASATTLARWGYRWDGRVDAADFRNSMTNEARASIDPATPKSGTPAWRSWLASRFALAAMAERAIQRPLRSGTADTLVYRESHDSAKGPMGFVEHHAIFHSPQQAVRARNAIRAAQSLASERQIPLLLVNAGLPIDPSLRMPVGSYRYHDLTTLLRRPFDLVQQENNLGWDPHLSSRGNRILAEALLNGLQCGTLLQLDHRQAPCAEVDEWQALSAGYWADHARRHATWASQFATRIDFLRPAGVHQIVGGIGMDRLFPLPPPSLPVARLLLKPGGTVLHIEADRNGPSDPGINGEMIVTLRLGEQAQQSRFALRTATFPAAIDFSALADRSPGAAVLEVDLACSGPCRPMRLSAIEVVPSTVPAGKPQ